MKHDPAPLAMRADLESVFRAHYPHVLATARRVLGSSSDADDVAQEVFIAFSRTEVPERDARAWLTVAAVHSALNQIRGNRRRAAREERSAIADSVDDTADDVVLADQRRRVRDALGRLPRQQATVLVLRHSGLSYAEIAAASDLSATSVGTTLRRAEAALRKELNDDASE